MSLRLHAIPKNLRGQRVIVRVDFNVPCRNGKVEDDLRIQRTLPTLQSLLKRNNKLILASHMEIDGKTPTLLPIAAYLKRHGIKHLRFIEGMITGERPQKIIESMDGGETLLLENIRLDAREKNNDIIFAKELAKLGDVYVNEAFSASHRLHSSIVGLPSILPSFAGDLFCQEVRHLSRAFHPPHPFVLIIGGRKGNKIGMLKRFLRKTDFVIIGGVIANSLLFLKNKEVGKSLVEIDEIKKDEKTMRAMLSSKKILFPEDVIVLRDKRKRHAVIDGVHKGDVIYDLGQETMRRVKEIIAGARFILWNGPLGYVERGFDGATRELVSAIRSSSAQTIAGGGDTAAFLNANNMIDAFSFVSTGGGAMLDFLSRGTLPGIEALQKSKK